MVKKRKRVVTRKLWFVEFTQCFWIQSTFTEACSIGWSLRSTHNQDLTALCYGLDSPFHRQEQGFDIAAQAALWLLEFRIDETSGPRHISPSPQSGSHSHNLNVSSQLSLCDDETTGKTRGQLTGKHAYEYMPLERLRVSKCLDCRKVLPQSNPGSQLTFSS